jgi:hypothetical protein
LAGADIYAARVLSRPRSILLLAVLAALLCAGLAQARSYPTPPTGPWTLGTGAGFTLKAAGKGKVSLTSLHLRSPVGEEVCPAKSVPVKVLGTYALKQFHRGGYTAWGVGKNVGGEPGDMAAKLVVAARRSTAPSTCSGTTLTPGRSSAAPSSSANVGSNSPAASRSNAAAAARRTLPGNLGRWPMPRRPKP